MEGASRTVYFLGEQETRGALLDPCTRLRFKVVSFASVAGFTDIAPTLDLGCLVVDMDSLNVRGGNLLVRLESAGVDFPIILVGDIGEAQPHLMQQLTIVGQVQKPIDADKLVPHLERARQLLSVRSVSELDSAAVARLKLLTKQERDVLSGIAAGMTNRAIAASLRISLRDVELCRVNLMNTLGVQSLSKLVRVALAGGIRVFR